MINQAGSTKYFILAELKKKELHGYDLMSRIESITGKKPSPSQIYPVLSQMQSLGYLSVRTRSIGKKKAKFYRLTKSGEKLYHMMNKRFDAIVKAALHEKIKVCAHCNCEIIKGAHAESVAGKRLYFCCVSCASSYKN